MSPNLIRGWLDGKWPMPARVENLLWEIAHQKEEQRGHRRERRGNSLRFC